MEPRKISDIVRDIMTHERLSHLDSVTQKQIEVCANPPFARTASVKRDDRIYLREIWRHLYAGGPLPEG